jgi:hypothetical protein
VWPLTHGSTTSAQRRDIRTHRTGVFRLRWNIKNKVNKIKFTHQRAILCFVGAEYKSSLQLPQKLLLDLILNHFIATYLLTCSVASRCVMLILVDIYQSLSYSASTHYKTYSSKQIQTHQAVLTIFILFSFSKRNTLLSLTYYFIYNWDNIRIYDVYNYPSAMISNMFSRIWWWSHWAETCSSEEDCELCVCVCVEVTDKYQQLFPNNYNIIFLHAFRLTLHNSCGGQFR